MDRIYDIIHEDNWEDDTEKVKKVQELSNLNLHKINPLPKLDPVRFTEDNYLYLKELGYSDRYLSDRLNLPYTRFFHIISKAQISGKYISHEELHYWEFSKESKAVHSIYDDDLYDLSMVPLYKFIISKGQGIMKRPPRSKDDTVVEDQSVRWLTHELIEEFIHESNYSLSTCNNYRSKLKIVLLDRNIDKNIQSLSCTNIELYKNLIANDPIYKSTKPINVALNAYLRWYKPDVFTKKWSRDLGRRNK